jgi:hypothetical protein
MAQDGRIAETVVITLGDQSQFPINLPSPQESMHEFLGLKRIG